MIKFEKISQNGAFERLTSQPVKYFAFVHGDFERFKERVSSVMENHPNAMALSLSDFPARNGIRRSYGIDFHYEKDGEKHCSRLDKRGLNCYLGIIDSIECIVCECEFSTFAYALV